MSCGVVAMWSSERTYRKNRVQISAPRRRLPRSRLDADLQYLPNDSSELCYIWAWSERTATMQVIRSAAPPQSITWEVCHDAGDCSLFEYRRSRRHLGISRARALERFRPRVGGLHWLGVLLPQRRQHQCTR